MALAARNITSTKKLYKSNSSDISVIIPAAGMGHRMKSYGPKGLINLYDDTSLLERQLELIWAVYPKADVFLVVGFEAEKIMSKLDDYPVRFISNPIHTDTNVLYSISLALQACLSKEVLIVYGDLIFNESCIRNLRGRSRVVVEDAGMMKKTEVGVCVQGKMAINFSFGLDTKWAQISYLTGNELDLFKHICLKRETSQWLGYEALNYVLENGGEIEAVHQKSMKIFEIDSARDLEKIPKNKLTFG
tara:strand:- start:2856 stop:3596 length:741 start_codon:yes stop_codon:yes gene_type:complete